MCGLFVPWVVRLHLSVRAATGSTKALYIRQLSLSRLVLHRDGSNPPDVFVLRIDRLFYITGQLGGMTVNVTIGVVS